MRLASTTLALIITCAVAGAAFADNTTSRWWKGNLHMHSYWSDGGVFPEMAVAAYKELGYHFVALTDHDILSRNDGATRLYEALAPAKALDMIPESRLKFFWAQPGHDGRTWLNLGERTREGRRGGDPEVLEQYIATYGEDWVVTREVDGELFVLLRPLSEFRTLFEAPGEFLMLESVELTGVTPAHMNAIFVSDHLFPAMPLEDGTTAVDLISENLDAVNAQRAHSGQPTIMILAHPNFHAGVTAEDLAAVEGLTFFEVYNGHRSVLNNGNELLADTDTMWDIALALRAAAGNPTPLYGIAADDAHDYEDYTNRHSSPGRGWVMVRAPFLTPEHLLTAMEAGDFYSTTGVVLDEVAFDGETLTVAVHVEPGVDYTIEFIGTLRDTPLEATPATNGQGDPLTEPRAYGPTDNYGLNLETHPWAVTKHYDEGVGAVLHRVEGSQASYTLSGDEWYVRARVVSSKPKENYFAEGEVERAWVQPVYPTAAR